MEKYKTSLIANRDVCMVVRSEGTKCLFFCHQQSGDEVRTEWQLINSFAYLKYLGKAHTQHNCIQKEINLLKTKPNLLYIRNQSVPRSKHFPPRL